MKKESGIPKTGKLLIAQPLLGDPNFDKTVVLLVDHNDEGSVGFVLNKPLSISLKELLIDFPAFEAKVYYGGPVRDDNLFFIHRKGDLIPGGQPLGNNLFWGGDIEPLKELIRTDLISPRDIRFFLGYSGWGGQQLKDELAQNSWLVEDLHMLDPLSQNPDEMWRSIIEAYPEDIALWINAPSDPNLN